MCLSSIEIPFFVEVSPCFLSFSYLSKSVMMAFPTIASVFQKRLCLTLSWILFALYVSEQVHGKLLFATSFIIVAKCGCKINFLTIQWPSLCISNLNCYRKTICLIISIHCYSFAFSTCITKQAFLDCHVVAIEVMDTPV